MNLSINSLLPVDKVEISVRHATPDAPPITACEAHSPNGILGKFIPSKFQLKNLT